MQKVVGGWYGCQVWGTVFRWQKMRWSNEHVVPQSLIHWGPARICYLGPLWVSLRQKLQNVPSINFLLLNDFTHNIYKKEVCHEPYISSFGINNYKTNLLVPQVVVYWRLCNIKVVESWVPSKDILDIHQVFLFLLCSHMWWGKGRRKRENKKEKEGEANPIMRDHHQNPMSVFLSPKALLANSITLGVNGGHSSIYSSYADLFLNQDRPSFESLFYSLFIFSEVF